jgi:DNA-binding Xre family transcriptional regulator
MPIVVRLDDMLHDRRMTLTELAERVDITLANLSILKTGKARAVRFSTLEAICEVLQCQPGDLLKYAPERSRMNLRRPQPLVYGASVFEYRRGLSKMTEITLFRLYLLRAAYLFIAVGLAATVWPIVIKHSPQWPLMNSVVCSLLAAVSVLAAVGIRYPLQMLPILDFEIVWKSIWLIAVALPLWSGTQIDARTCETVRDCLVGVIFIPLIPWRYVISHYITQIGDPWMNGRNPSAAEDENRLPQISSRSRSRWLSSNRHETEGACICMRPSSPRSAAPQVDRPRERGLQQTAATGLAWRSVALRSNGQRNSRSV